MFIRFGQVPEEGRSINWKALSFRQQSSVTYSLRMGDSIEEAIWKEFAFTGDEEPVGLWEAGISAFRADENGLPMIENEDLRKSLEARIGDELFAIDADEIGTGADGEPLLANIRKIEKIQIGEEILRELAK